MYANTIYGARSSMVVGLATTIMVVLIGSFLGTMAGFFGGKTDSVLSRTADVFFGIPFLLGALLVLTTFPSEPDTPAWQTIGKVVLTLTILGWPTFLQAHAVQRDPGARQRLRRGGAVAGSLQQPADPPPRRAQLALGGHRGRDALPRRVHPRRRPPCRSSGIGLQPPVISWGAQISEAVPFLRVAPFMLFFPSLFLSVCVLSFMMLGDAVKDALDPKLR